MSETKKTDRRKFLKNTMRTCAALAVGGVTGLVAVKSSSQEMLWQIDPTVCVQCEKCAENCVLAISAVKCVHAFDVCGYCDLCGGYLQPGTKKIGTGAEVQLCPTGAIKRNYIENPYYEYTIDEAECIGCAKCVKGCGAFGNGSLYLQVRHDRCVNCNECAIAKSCPSGAFRRVPKDQPYILKGKQKKT